MWINAIKDIDKLKREVYDVVSTLDVAHCILNPPKGSHNETTAEVQHLGFLIPRKGAELRLQPEQAETQTSDSR